MSHRIGHRQTSLTGKLAWDRVKTMTSQILVSNLTNHKTSVHSNNNTKIASTRDRVVANTSHKISMEGIELSLIIGSIKIKMSLALRRSNLRVPRISTKREIKITNCSRRRVRIAISRRKEEVGKEKIEM